MAGPNTPARTLHLFVFFACIVIVAVGLWYVKSGGWEHEQDIADDEEVIDLNADGGGHRRGSKKTAPRLKKKSSEARQARGSAPRPGPSPAPLGPSGMSYEAAIAGNNQNLAPGTKDVPDLTDAELAGPMREGTFLDACDVPTSTQVTVKVAIKGGRAVGVSVYMVPPSRELGWCVERHVRGIQWPSNAKMDSFVTTY
jgi:eukaryotic-like serine/threonine-protein kinase